jgi:hypothetical protein
MFPLFMGAILLKDWLPVKTNGSEAAPEAFREIAVAGFAGLVCECSI